MKRCTVFNPDARKKLRQRARHQHHSISLSIPDDTIVTQVESGNGIIQMSNEHLYRSEQPTATTTSNILNVGRENRMVANVIIIVFTLLIVARFFAKYGQ